MSADGLLLELRSKLEAGLDMSPLLPQKLQELKQSEIAAIKLDHGAEQVAAGDIFRIRGRSSSKLIRINGGSSYMHSVGAGISSGSIMVAGDVGDDCGLGMSGGRVKIHGNSGDFTGSGMSSGVIVIAGNCGDDCAGIRPGGHAALSGGLLQVQGNSGDRAGATMSGGTLLLEGSCGFDLAMDMKAGTMLALSGCMGGVARGMKRGTIILNKPGFRPGNCFAGNGEHDLNIVRIIMRDLASRAVGLRFLKKYPMLVHRYTGDLAVDGVGEILVPVHDFLAN